MSMILPSFEYAIPADSSVNVSLDTDLSFTFSEPISFAKTKGEMLRLYFVSDPDKVVWQADPESGHTAEGKMTVVFDDLPMLEPDTSYFLLTDRAWINLGARPVSGLNDGAFYYRFRTAANYTN